jgi:predicted NACHT family NTPase
VRNLYLFLAFVFALDSKLVHVLINTSNSVHDYVLDRLLVQTLIPALNLELDLTFVFALSNIDYALDIDPKLKQALQQLKNQLPNPYEDIKGFQQWWIANGQAWSAKLRMLMINYRNIGQDWHFSSRAGSPYYLNRSTLKGAISVSSSLPRMVSATTLPT